NPVLAACPSAPLVGVDGLPITVEVHISTGLPAFTVVGLPDTSCREARDRVRASLLSSQYRWPNRRVTEKVLRPEDIEGTAFIGELGLDGSIRAVRGVLSMVQAVEQPRVVVPEASYGEASA